MAQPANELHNYDLVTLIYELCQIMSYISKSVL